MATVPYTALTMTTEVSIPDRHKPTLVKMVGFTADVRSGLLAAVRAAVPRLGLDEFADDVKKRVQLSKTEVADVLRVLTSMYISMDRESLSVSEFVSGVRTGLESEKVTPASGDWHEFSQWLSTLLTLEDSLGVTAKALGLLEEFEYTFCQSRILTDLRPIFKRDPSQAPSVGMIVHQLRISVHAEETENDKDLYVALDHESLIALRGDIERALAKEASLKSSVAQGGMRILED